MWYKKLVLLVMMLTLSSCFDFGPEGGGTPNTFGGSESPYTPVKMNRPEFEAAVKFLEAQPIENAGKIYVKGDYLFVGDTNKGFHIVDNSNPSDPQRIKFIQAPGATDLIIKEDILYINQAVDLIALKYDIPSQSLLLTKRIKNVFPQKPDPNGIIPLGTVAENEIIINWEQ